MQCGYVSVCSKFRARPLARFLRQLSSTQPTSPSRGSSSMSHPQGCSQNDAGHRDVPSSLRGVQAVRQGRTRRWRDAAIIAICALCVHVLGCSKLLTTKPDPGERFDAPLDGLDNGELGDFQAGHTQFRKSFTIAEGLGPIFNNVSCASCHSGDGRGRPENILIRFSRGTDLALDVAGPQIQDKYIPGAEPEQLPAVLDVSRRMPPPDFG